MAPVLVVMESKMKREVVAIQPDRAVVEQRLLVVRDGGGGPAEWSPRARDVDTVFRVNRLLHHGVFFAAREQRQRHPPISRGPPNAVSKPRVYTSLHFLRWPE